MELKKGMWVITNDRMELGQIKDFCTCEMCEKRGFYEPIIGSNSHMYITDYDKSQGFHGYKFYDNLIDLIEVGDYVNGEKVTSAEPVDEKDTDRYLGFGNYDYYIHTSEDIKSVVTKEQFNACKYVVERDD